MLVEGRGLSWRWTQEAVKGDIETLEIEKTVSEGEDVPTQAERSAIERVQSTLKQSKAAIEVELEMKG
jgi:hypothetical protein